MRPMIAGITAAIDRFGSTLTVASIARKAMVSPMSPGDARVFVSDAVANNAPRPLMRAMVAAGVTAATGDTVQWRGEDYEVVAISPFLIGDDAAYQNWILVRSATLGP